MIKDTIWAGGCLHGDFPHLNRFTGDYPMDFVYLGDCCPKGLSAKEQMVYMRYVFFPWVEKFPNHINRYLIPGNHDAWAELDEARSICEEFDFNLIIDQSFNLVFGNRTYKCYGTPWTVKPKGWNKYHWAFGDEDGNLEDRFEQIPHDVDIVFSHSPAYGMLDCGLTSDDRMINIGSQSLRQVLEYRKFKYFIHSHEHFHGGKTVYHPPTNKKYINVAQQIMEISF